MNTDTAHFTLELTARGNWKSPLYPEQTPDFDLVLRNTGSSTVSALPLYGSFETPRIVLSRASGATIGIYTKADMYRRQVGDPERQRPEPPEFVEMAPGKGSQISVSAWDYHSALPPGSYAIAAEHRTAPGGAFIRSNRFGFEVVAASVKSMAIGYDSAGRLASVLAWLAAEVSAANASERLLVRISSAKGHSSLMMGATSHGEYPAGSLVSVGQGMAGTRQSPRNWLAVLSGGQVTAIRHTMSIPSWRSEPVALPISGGVPVPRFPSMNDQMLFLATGAGSKGAVLAGAMFQQPTGLLQQWTVPVNEKPSLTACLARLKRPASLLLAANGQGGSRISRLDVSFEGKLMGSEKLLRQSKNTVMAVAPAFDPASGDAFFVLECSAEEPDRLALVTIPMSGPARADKPKPTPGWPRDDNGKAVKAVQTQIEQAVDGTIALALVDARGFFYGGKLRPKAFVGQLRDKADSPCSFPQIGALSRNATPACFTSEGMLFAPGAESEE